MKMTPLNKNNQHFIINDILLPIDPQNISVFKEGLDWGGSTLRDKVSAKVLSGNGVFNVQVSLIFTRAMYLHLHRLVCQIRNSPFVYIENKYITQQVEEGLGTGKLFAVSSLQLVPMQNSPGTFICELNLVYVNEKVFTSSLLYKKDVLVNYSLDKVGTFSIYGENEETVFEKTSSERTQTTASARKKVKKINEESIGFLKTNAVIRPSESNAYVKYSNYLQIQSLRKNFGISSKEIKAIFNNDLLKIEGGYIEGNNRFAYGIHSSEISAESRIALIELMIQGREDDLTLLFEEYRYLKLSKGESETYRKKLTLNSSKRVTKEERLKQQQEKKLKVFEELIEGAQRSSLGRKISALDREQFSPYLERPEYRNLFYKKAAFVLKNGNPTISEDEDTKTSFFVKNTLVTNISSGFRPNLSIIPISGSKFPTVQFLGGVEPVYQVDILSRGTTTADELPEGIRQFNNIKDTLQSNSINFKIIPDSGYASLDCLVTRLLGTYEEEDYIVEGERPLKKRVVFKSITNSTVEGSPGTARASMVFVESKPYDSEKLKPIRSTRSSSEERRVRSLSQTTFKAKEGSGGSGDNLKSKYEASWYEKTDLNGIPGEYHTDLNILKDITLTRLATIQSAITKCFGNEARFIITPNGKLEKVGRDKVRTTASNHFVNSAVDIKVAPGSELTEYKLVHFIQALREIGYLKKDERLKNNSLFVMLYHNGDAENKGVFIHIDHRMKVTGSETRENPSDEKSKITEIDYSQILRKENGVFVNDGGPSNVLYIQDKKTGSVVKNANYNTNLLNEYKVLIQKNLDLSNSTEEEIVAVNAETEETEEESSLIEEFDLKAALKEYKSATKISEFDSEKVLLKSLDSQLKTKIKTAFGNEGATLVDESDEIDVIKSSNEVRKTLLQKGVRFVEEGGNIYIRRKEATYLSKLEQEEEAVSIIEMLENFKGLASFILTEPPYYTAEIKPEINRIQKILGEEELAPCMNLYSIYLLNKLLEEYSGNSGFKAIVAGTGIGAGIALLVFATGGLALAGGGLLAGGLTSGVSATTGTIDGTNLDRVKLEIKEELFHLNNVYVEVVEKMPSLTKDLSEEVKFDVYDINSGETFQNAVNELALKAFLENPFLKLFKKLHLKTKSRAIIASAIGFTEIEEGENLENASIGPIISYNEIQEYLTCLAALPIENEYGIDDSVLNEIFYLQFKKSNDIYTSVFEDTGNKENYYFPTLGKSWKEFADSLNKESYKLPTCIAQWEGDGRKHIRFNQYFSREEIESKQEQKIAYLKNLKETLIRALLNNSEVKKTLGITESNLFEEILDNQESCYPDIEKPADPRFKKKLMDPWFFYYDIIEENSAGFKYLEKRRDENVTTIIQKSAEFEKAIGQGLLNARSTSAGEIDVEVSKLADPRSIELIDSRVRDISEGAYDTRDSQIGSDEIIPVKTGNEVVATEPFGTSREAPPLKFEEVFGRKLYSKEEKEKMKKEVSEESKKFTQPFSTESLIEGAKISNAEFLKDRRSYKKMFPTFKLYFVEEDAVESDELFIFDDFFSYNGVRSFSFYNNKKLAATTAQISLQNISGILDGTKPLVSRDVDIRQDVLGDEELDLASNVQSIIVRPGLNVQLRAGYSENASDLKVLLSGRVTEVQWSSGGDICDIIVQSYGVELVNKKFGVGINDPLSSKTFYNTHTLLGNLALNESLKHFGRYKKGRVFQIGENKELSIDLNNYKDDSWFIPVFTEGVGRWLYEHKIAIAVAAIATDAALSFLPTGFLGKSGSFIKGAFTKSSTTAAVKSASTTSAARILLSNVFGGIKSISQQNALLKALGTGIKGFSKATSSQIIKIGKAFNTTINGFFTRSATSKVIAQIEKEALPAIKANIDGLLKKSFSGKALSELTEAELKSLYSQLRTVNIPATLSPGIFTAVRNFFATSNYTLKNLGTRNLSGEALIAELTNILGTRSLIKAGVHPAFSIKGGMTSFFQNAGYDLFSRLPRSMASGYMKFISIGFVLDTFISVGNSVKNWIYDAWREKTNPRTLKLLLEPQDDNLYPPEPSMYLKRTSQGVSGAVGDFFNKAWITVLNSIRIATLNATQGLEEALENYDAFLDKRLSIKDGENEYNIKNSNIWEMFEEMTLRHPGWIAAARPYGQGMEYRLFFGVPSQRWWSKPLNNTVAEYLNSISIAYTNSKGGTSLEVGKALFPNSAEAELAKLGAEAIAYWQKTTEERYVPFRKYHYVRSGVNLISNKLRVESGIINEVVVAYESTRPEAVEIDEGTNSGKRYLIRNIRGSQHIPEELINSKNVGDYPNIKGAASAFRYGYSMLINSAKEMYSGEILVLGAPDIEPFDVCILNDNYSDMHGPIEVEAVTHMFSTSTGFITEIKPNAIAFGNEQMTAPSLASTIVGMSQQKLLEKYPNLSRLGNKREVIEDIVTDQIDEYFSGTDNFIGKALFRLFNDKEALNGKTRKVIIDQIQKNIKEGNLRGLESIIERSSIKGVADRAVEGTLNLTAIAAGTAALIQGTRSAILNQAGIATLNGASTASFGLGAGGLSSNAVKIALGAIAANVFFRDKISAGIDDSFRNGELGSRIFGNLMINKVSEGSVVRIMPVVKYGKPVLAGGYERTNPKNSFKIVFGEYRNLLSDALQSYEEKKIEYEELAKLAGFKNLEAETTALGRLTRIGIGLTKVVGGGAFQQAWLRGGVSDIVAGATGEMSPGAINAFIQEKGAE